MIFLSASIPDQSSERKYTETADVIAIRDSVRALASVVIPNSRLIWGGHPAITPLIRYVIESVNPGLQLKKHITLYQSDFYKNSFPKDNLFFENIIKIPANVNELSSVNDMRNRMIKDNEYKVGIFIGGRQGVEREFSLFKEVHPKALLLPIASTGAAARIIYNGIIPRLDVRLLNDYAYMSLFKSLLKEYI